MDFSQQLPQYTGKLKRALIHVRQQADQFEKTRQAVMPQNPADQQIVRVKQVGGGISSETQATITESLIAASFIPFLAYFMLSWQQHIRVGTVKLFSRQDRTSAYVALSQIARMLRSFIVGNLLIGAIMGVASAAAFWAMGIPYYYFIGLISGYLSLVPYLGVVLATVPPLAAGVGALTGMRLSLTIGAVVLIHLLALNVLYPKILGRRLQLNPLVVTVSLLFWGFLWGGLGLLLAVPITAAIKIVCEHITSLQPLGELMGEGE